MGKVKIKVNDYYGNPSYYSVMPGEIFDALELASLKGIEHITVEKMLYDKMISDYEIKMSRCSSGSL